jgi:hypothetical protein
LLALSRKSVEFNASRVILEHLVLKCRAEKPFLNAKPEIKTAGFLETAPE